MVALAGEFAGGVESHVGSEVCGGRGVIEGVGGVAGQQGVAFGVGVGAHAKQDVAGVVDVAVCVDDDDVFCEHHLTHSPEAVHDFEGLPRVLFPDGDEDEVVEDAFGGKCDVDNLGEVHLKHGEEDANAC